MSECDDGPRRPDWEKREKPVARATVTVGGAALALAADPIADALEAARLHWDAHHDHPELARALAAVLARLLAR